MKKKQYWNFTVLVCYCILGNLDFVYKGYIDSKHSDKYMIIYLVAGAMALLNLLNMVLLQRFRKEGNKKDYLIAIITSAICLSGYIYIFIVDLAYLPLFRLFKTPSELSDILILTSPFIILYNIIFYTLSVFRQPHDGLNIK